MLLYIKAYLFTDLFQMGDQLQGSGQFVAQHALLLFSFSTRHLKSTFLSFLELHNVIQQERLCRLLRAPTISGDPEDFALSLQLALSLHTFLSYSHCRFLTCVWFVLLQMNIGLPLFSPCRQPAI